MELPGTSYLYNLTMISVTFAGFAALIAAFRQMVGGRLTRYDAFPYFLRFGEKPDRHHFCAASTVACVFQTICSCHMACIELDSSYFNYPFHSVLAAYKTHGDRFAIPDNGQDIFLHPRADCDLLANGRAWDTFRADGWPFRGWCVRLYAHELVCRSVIT